MITGQFAIVSERFERFALCSGKIYFKETFDGVAAELNALGEPDFLLHGEGDRWHQFRGGKGGT